MYRRLDRDDLIKTIVYLNMLRDCFVQIHNSLDLENATELAVSITPHQNESLWHLCRSLIDDIWKAACRTGRLEANSYERLTKHRGGAAVTMQRFLSDTPPDDAISAMLEAWTICNELDDSKGGRTAQYSVGLSALLWRIISQKRFVAPITFVGFTALSVEIMTNFLTPYFSAARTTW